MRLLEFNRDQGGANPQQAMRRQAPRKTPARPAEAPQKPAPAATDSRGSRLPIPPDKAKVFPVKTSNTRKTIRRGPIDLEQLQQRIALLERRIQARLEQASEQPANKELELLKQRMKLLERKFDNQLWLASQREQSMLELLSRPTLKVQIKQKLARLWQVQLPAASRWLLAIGKGWWSDNQPRWWPELARAWQESLEKARR